jgi:O-antigen/teichoic acid export membrane protein
MDRGDVLTRYPSTELVGGQVGGTKGRHKVGARLQLVVDDRPEPEREEPGELDTAVRRGLGLSLLNNGLVRLGGVVAGIVIARLLVPEDFGVFAVALVVLNALLSINEMGVSLAIVRWPRDPERVTPTVMTLSVTCSVGLYLLTFLAAPTIASQLGAPQATPMIRVLALSMIVDGVSAVPAALLTRYFQQGRRLAADLTGFVLSTALTVILAALGYGAWSLVVGYLVGNVATSIVVWVLAPRRPWFGWDASLVPELLGFGLPLAGSSLLVFGVLNVANVVVGAELGPVELGFYALAFNLASWPVAMFSLAVRRVAMAGFARVAHDRVALEDSFARSVALLLGVTLPVCALQSVLAEPLIHVVYGAKWAPAADVLRWLAVLAAARVVAELTYDLLVAVAHSRAIFAVQGLWLVALLPALLVGARLDGVRGVAMAQAAVACAVVLPAFLIALRRAGVRTSAGLRHTGRPILATAALVAVVLAFGSVVDGDLSQLLLLSAAGAAVGGVILLPLRRLAR